ncbi:DNA-(apurinic or apyrimidinic site) lyase [Purpureocillium takamizusanense]|uniref:Endonuclease III homolog n=1 Tax=Purpureocillium takamizusanense TaxID=2060973 RepID=A0A9Q8VCE0_9HYPO|nr:DNA-(apurinic or apyrimidinic site) lyase [Purpureocillium takamizusanense]UNI20628.1 DNA-(apurinic or apyrimidinic site) lyase [Purpureocillium takamizusanense]
MRSSRVSKDTSKLFERASEIVAPRRVTRSLSRFSYAGAGALIKSGTPDIEDAVPPAKRRRIDSDDGDDAPVVKVKAETLEEALTAIPSPPPKPKPKPKRERKPARKTTDPDTGEATVAPPSDWEDIYNTVKKMRQPGGIAHGAAVDTMGCERLADRNASPKDQRFHTLVALMLSSQTKDTVNAVAMQRLKTELPAHKPGAPIGLSLDNMLAVDPKLLNQMIWAVGFHNNKTKYLKQAAVILRDKWDGDIPDTIEGLMSLPGVGPKMAYLCMSVAWDRTEGIGVDVHVHRLTNLWGWNKTKSPEETRHSLQSWLPRDKWREINWLLVGFGQAVCLPVGRRCGDCDLGAQGLCKAADRKKVAEGRRIKGEEEVKVEKVEVQEASEFF